jgi:hypothetical protein|tara:strand:- start:54 stop:497 length:444 start_codon:yes stop_codon:yes gene_type:complete
MAVTASGLFVLTFRDILDSTQMAVDTGSDTFKCAMITNSSTPNFETHDHWSDLSGNEVSGTGYTAGGAALTSITLGNASGTLKFDAADTSWTTATISSARAAVIYDDTLANDPLICLVNFGADYASSAGTFQITWNASGIWTIDLTP